MKARHSRRLQIEVLEERVALNASASYDIHRGHTTAAPPVVVHPVVVVPSANPSLGVAKAGYDLRSNKRV